MGPFPPLLAQPSIATRPAACLSRPYLDPLSCPIPLGSVTMATEEAWDDDFSLLGFGVDSFVEVLSALFVLAKLWNVQQAAAAVGAGGPRHRSCCLQDRHTLYAIAVALLALGASSCAGGLFKLIQRVDHTSSVAGIVVSSVSITGMLLLWYYKSLCAVYLNSAVLEADAACSLSCIVLSIALLVSSVLRTASDALWWVDGVSAVVLGLLIGREGVHTARSAWLGGDGACGCENRWVLAQAPFSSPTCTPISVPGPPASRSLTQFAPPRPRPPPLLS
jgi:hypothetical protein